MSSYVFFNKDGRFFIELEYSNKNYKTDNFSDKMLESPNMVNNDLKEAKKLLEGARKLNREAIVISIAALTLNACLFLWNLVSFLK